MKKKENKTKGEWGQKKQENKQNMGGEKPKLMEKNPNGDERKTKTKIGVFTIWQLNLLAPVRWQQKWIWSPPLDGDQNGFGCHH